MSVVVDLEKGRRPLSIDDPKDATPEIVKFLVEWLCRSPVGISAVQQAATLLPPPAELREAGPAEQVREGVFVRPEYVRCNKARCKKDEHGPYWYSYRRINGKWKREYVGKEHPRAEDLWTLEDAQRTIAELLRLRRLDREQMNTLCQIANAMGAIAEDAKALELQRAARNRLVEEEKLSAEHARREFEELSTAVRQGRELSPEEAKQLQSAADFLSFNH